MHPILQAFLATCFTWALTALGAALVFLAREPSRRTLDSMLGFAAGVMMAASYWSLLAPAIDLSAELGFLPGYLRSLVFYSAVLHSGSWTECYRTCTPEHL